MIQLDIMEYLANSAAWSVAGFLLARYLFRRSEQSGKNGEHRR